MSTNLYARSCYTLLKSTVRIEELVQEAVKDGYKSAALTDHNVMFGTASFIDACNKNHIHPIIGLEADCLFEEETVPFLLLAKDNRGYEDLMRLSTILSGDEHTCTLEQLIKAAEHCILIVYGEDGWFDGELVKGDMEGVKEKLSFMKKKLPPFDVAISFQEAALWRDINPKLKRICIQLGIRTAAINKACYLNKNDKDAYLTLKGISSNGAAFTKGKTAIRENGSCFLNQKEMAKLYETDDLKRTDEIAEMCRADGELPKTSLPKFHLKNGITSEQYLPELARAGLRKRLKGKEIPEYAKRLEYELSVIARMHFEDYFLIVYDFIRYARTNGIYVGPGRGSAAGSLCAYCLGITMIDPMKYNLLFERFLNPERVTMPDIDTDIPDDRRDEVLKYVYDTYGSDHVAKIAVFGTLAAKQVVRDVAKVMKLPAGKIDTLVGMIPERSADRSQKRITLKEALNTSKRLSDYVKSDEKVQAVIEMAMRLEGLPRHTSIHAAGIVMSLLPLSSIIPLMKGDDEFFISQYEEAYLEKRGLIKMDFLGLRNLSMIDQIVTEIKKKEPAFDILGIPLDDTKTLDVFRRVDTLGIFQFESRGMQKLLRQMRPENFNDIVAANALFRPGPMQNINLYLENRKNPAGVQYPSKELEPILKETYGIMVYQEQTMLVAQKAAGFTLGKADLLRRAISKKHKTEIVSMQKDFISGCVKNGYTEDTAKSLFVLIEKFAGYGFNKSHAVAYALIAWQTAYLKARYPMYFYTAMINYSLGDQNKMALYVNECRQRKIQIEYPDVNEADAYCTVIENKIILPFSAVKGVGIYRAQEIAAERKANGPYKDYFDFVARCVMRKIDRKIIEALIDGGALDSLGLSRRTCKSTLDRALNYADMVIKTDGGQMTLDLGIVSPPVFIRLADDPDDRNACEREVLGFSLAPSPIGEMKRKLNIQTPAIASMHNMRGRVEGFGRIQNVNRHRARTSGREMAYVTLEDETGSIEMTVFARQYETYRPGLVKGVYVMFSAKAEGNENLICETVRFIKKNTV
jgi:DNA polymerase-3 subunit alpha